MAKDKCRRDKVADFLKAEIVKDFRKVKEDLIKLSEHVGPQEAMKFGINLITLANMGFDEKYEAALRM